MGCGASKPTDGAASAAAPAAPEPVPAPAPAVTEETPAEKPAVESAEPAVEVEPAATEEAPAVAEPSVAPEDATTQESSPKSKFNFKKGNSAPLTPLDKFHSTVRWNKGLDAIKEFLTEDSSLATSEDPKNGNQALHLASQNGHLDIVKLLIEEYGADVNCTNKKSQTPLHMSIAYDLYDVCQYILDAGADREKENVDGHKAITGIDGDHVGKWEWGSPMHAFKAISDEESMKAAFDALEATDDTMLDKLSLAQTGLRLKKTLADVWDADRFQAIVKRAPAPEA